MGPRAPFVGLVLGIALVGCAPANPTPSPSPSMSPSAVATSPLAPSATPAATAAQSPSAPATAESTPTSAPATASGWTAVPSQASVLNVQFLDVVWTGTRFVAIGSGHEDSGAFLDSSDGLTWHIQSNPAKGYPDDVAVGPHGLVAVGTIGDRLASWASADGLAWTSRSDAFPLPTHGTDVIKVTSVVSTDDGWLAVGRRDPECMLDCGLAPVRAMAWTSKDGLKWARVADQASFGKAGMTGVARLGSSFVAVGQAKSRAVAWISADGSTWTRAADDPALHPRTSLGSGAYMLVSGVAVGHGVVVAFGIDGGGVGEGGVVRAWRSLDGRTWTKATGERFATGQVFSVVATPEGFLATGPSGEDSCRGGIWSSADGKDWRCIAQDPAFEGFAPYASAASPSVEVVVGLGNGTDASGAGEPGAVWWRPVP